MSPPAQKALSPIPLMMTQLTPASFSHRSSAAAISRTIFKVSALSALGRLSVTMPQEPTFSQAISGSLMTPQAPKRRVTGGKIIICRATMLHGHCIALFCAGGLAKKLKTGHFPSENEIAVIELERARNTVFIEVERQ